jgi:hypothetical protein
METSLLEAQGEKLQTAKDNAFWGASTASFSNLFVSGINSNILQGNFETLRASADAIELQALERANQLRESFSKAVGDYVYVATKRGFKTDSGSVQSNIEESSMNLSKDIQKEAENARAEANVQRLKADAQRGMKDVALLDGLSKAFTYGSKI